MTYAKIHQIVKTLKKLDLSKYPTNEILKQFKLSKVVPTIISTLHPGKIIVRGQCFDASADYTFINRHSYKPQQSNKTYQRASTPLQTMFYGAITAEEEEENMPVAEHIVFTEIQTPKEFQTIVYSHWEVIEDIELLSIVQSGTYSTPSKGVLSLQQLYKKEFKKHPGVEFMNFIASEFSKEQIRDDYDYVISGWYAKMACELGYYGVEYPSVKVGGAGMNVAINPKAVDTKMKFIKAYECDFKKEGMQINEVARRNINITQ